MLPYLIGLGIGAFIGGGIGKAIAATEISDTAQEINDMAIAGVKNANEVLKNYQDIMTEQLTELGKTKRRIMKARECW